MDGRRSIPEVERQDGAFERDPYHGRFDPAPGLDPKRDMRLARQRVDSQPIVGQLARLDTEKLGHALVDVSEEERCHLRYTAAGARRISPNGTPLAVADE